MDNAPADKEEMMNSQRLNLIKIALSSSFSHGNIQYSCTNALLLNISAMTATHLLLASFGLERLLAKSNQCLPSLLSWTAPKGFGVDV